MNHSAAPFSLSVRLISAVVCVLLLAVFILIASQRSAPPIALALVALPCLGLPVLTWLLSPSRYAIDGRFLVLHRQLGARRIELGTITGCTIEATALHASLRLLASGGLFGFFGTFYNRRWGRYRAYVTNPAQSVIVSTESGTLVLSPENPERFVHDLERAVSRHRAS